MINILGLATAFASVWLIYHYVRFQYSYEDSIPHREELFFVGEQHPGVDQVWYYTRTPILPALLENYPEVVEGTRMEVTYEGITQGENQFSERGMYVDSSFFSVFATPFLHGNPATCLQRKDQIVLTQALAEKYFPDQDPLNQVLRVGYEDKIVSGVIADFPENTDFTADFLLSHDIRMEHYEESNPAMISWYSTAILTVLRLQPGAQLPPLSEKITELVLSHTPEDAESPATFSLLPMKAFHLNSPSQRRQLSIMILIAIAVWVIATINFANLLTARSLTRFREIGVRKVLGAQRFQIGLQFLGESLTIAAIGVILGIGLADLVLPLFNKLMEVPLESYQLFGGIAVFIPVVMIAIAGLLGSLYPAWILSRLSAQDSLKERVHASTGTSRLRNGLVVVQFTLSMVLIAGTLLMWNQIQFMQSKDLKIDTEQIVSVPVFPQYLENPEQAVRQIPILQQQLETHSQIEKVSASHRIPFNLNMWGGVATPVGKEEEVRVRFNLVDDEFFSLYGLELISGRLFTDSLQSTTVSQVVINETAAKAMGWENPVGQRFNMGWGEQPYEVIGLVKDFHYTSLELPIEPVLFQYSGTESSFYSYLSIRVGAGELDPVLAYIDQTLSVLNPATPFNKIFLDESYQEIYENYERNGTLLGILTGLAILIACLGLLGLVSFAAVRRTKEIGIRKVLGASLSQLVSLFVKSYTLMLGISILIAVPITWWWIQSWLEDFAYQDTINPWMFLISGVMLLFFTWLTVSYHAFKVSMANPVQALRDE